MDRYNSKSDYHFYFLFLLNKDENRYLQPESKNTPSTIGFKDVYHENILILVYRFW